VLLDCPIVLAIVSFLAVLPLPDCSRAPTVSDPIRMVNRQRPVLESLRQNARLKEATNERVSCLAASAFVLLGCALQLLGALGFLAPAGCLHANAFGQQAGALAPFRLSVVLFAPAVSPGWRPRLAIAVLAGLPHQWPPIANRAGHMAGVAAKGRAAGPMRWNGQGSTSTHPEDPDSLTPINSAEFMTVQDFCVDNGLLVRPLARKTVLARSLERP